MVMTLIKLYIQLQLIFKIEMEKVPQLNMFSSQNRRSLGKQTKYCLENSFYSDGLNQPANRGGQKLRTGFKCTQNYYNQALKLLGSGRREKLTNGGEQIRIRQKNEINLQQFRKRNQLPEKVMMSNPQVIINQRPVLIQQSQPQNMGVAYHCPSPQQQVFIRPQTPPPRGPVFYQNGPFTLNQNVAQPMNSPMFVPMCPVPRGSPLIHSTSVQQMSSYEQMTKTAPMMMYYPSRQNDEDHIIQIDQDPKPQLKRQYTFREDDKNSNGKQNKAVSNKRNPFSLDSAYLLQVQDCERRLPQLSRVYNTSEDAEQSYQKQTLMTQLMEMREQNLKSGDKCVGDLDKILQRFGSEQGKQSIKQECDLNRTRKSLFGKAK